MNDKAREDRRPPEAGGRHLDDQEMALLLERGAAALDASLQAHLSECDTCRHEWLGMLRQAEAIASSKDLQAPPPHLQHSVLRRTKPRDGSHHRRSTPRGRREWWRPSVPVLSGLAAALILLGLGLLLAPPPNPPDRSPHRAGQDGPGIDLIRPRGAITTAPPLVFEWTAAPGATSYELVIADPARGSEVVLRLAARDNRRQLTTEERRRLVPGTRYQWLVWVQRGLWRSEASGLVEFTLTPPETIQEP